MDIVGWTVLIGNVTISDLHFLDLISVSAHGAQHADTLSCSFESFSFQFLCTVLEPRNVKSVERQIFQISLEQFYFYFIPILFLRCKAVCWKAVLEAAEAKLCEKFAVVFRCF